jgi:predicted ArsR family transcriptional regulator
MLRDAAVEIRVLEVSLVSLEFVRDMVLITCGDGDLVDALIFTTALDANMGPVDDAPDLSVKYGGADNSAPDELRRPVSMHAVAQSLGLPVETVRRRFARLVESGACLATPQGIVVPRTSVVSQAYKAIQRARYQRTRDFYRALTAMGALPPADRVEAAPDEPLIRAANRAISEYALRASRSLVGLTGDPLSTLILVKLVLENSRGLDMEALVRWIRAPEAEARPVRIPRLAAGLPASGETVRRHLKDLQALGFCRRVPGGLIAAPAAGAAPRLVELARDNLRDLQRVFARLASLGVLAEWDAEPPPID